MGARPETFSAARARHDPARFWTSRIDEFAADPVGTVESIYARFGLPLSGQAADAMRALTAEQRAGDSRPVHRYTLADFGLAAEQVDERFAAHPQG